MALYGAAKPTPFLKITSLNRDHAAFFFIVSILEMCCWFMTSISSRRLNAFDQWCLHRIRWILYVVHVTNDDVRHRTYKPPVNSAVMPRRLHLFGPCQPISWPLTCSSGSHQPSPSEWHRRAYRPRRTWLWTHSRTGCPPVQHRLPFCIAVCAGST